jgi:hypothetical protein
MKTILKFVLFINLFAANIYSQQPDFFPLNIGNEYQFKGRNQQEYYFGKIDKDTLYPTGKLYFTLPDRCFEFGNTRVDSNGNVLSVSKRFFGGDPEEQMLFKSDAVLDEVWPVAWNFNPVIDTGYAKCIYVDSGFIFGKNRLIKGVLIFDASYYYYYFWLADGIGLIRSEYDDGSGLDINYVKIDDKIYGTLVSVENEFAPIPQEFTVSQNYPNPFNGTTRIEVRLPNQLTDDLIKFSICNILGFKIYEQNYKAAKLLMITFNTDVMNLSSGTYFFSVSYGSKTITKKFLLLK